MTVKVGGYKVVYAQAKKQFTTKHAAKTATRRMMQDARKSLKAVKE